MLLRCQFKFGEGQYSSLHSIHYFLEKEKNKLNMLRNEMKILCIEISFVFYKPVRMLSPSTLSARFLLGKRLIFTFTTICQ